VFAGVAGAGGDQVGGRRGQGEKQRKEERRTRDEMAMGGWRPEGVL
jgi:hypothetical protein